MNAECIHEQMHRATSRQAPREASMPLKRRGLDCRSGGRYFDFHRHVRIPRHRRCPTRIGRDLSHRNLHCVQRSACASHHIHGVHFEQHARTREWKSTCSSSIMKPNSSPASVSATSSHRLPESWSRTQRISDPLQWYRDPVRSSVHHWEWHPGDSGRAVSCIPCWNMINLLILLCFHVVTTNVRSLRCSRPAIVCGCT